MSSEVWHAVEQASFLAAGLLFWWPIVQPWPSVARLPQWSAPLYLFLATLPCDALSAFLTFCDRVVYPSYLSTQQLFDLSALQDQQWAGTLMWVWVTFAYLAPAASITTRLLSPRMAKTVEYSR
jgi:cytochrome c oxidase assembly factor CtaG